MVSPRRIVVVGTSLGGLTALEEILGALPRAFGAPIVVVQHRTKDGDDGMRRVLQRRSALPVVEAEDKLTIEPGRVYIAPADYHTLVDREDDLEQFELSTDAPVNSARPSVDVLFQSAAEAYGAGAIAVVLTGLNTDGARGVRRIKECGGTVLVQDPATAEAGSMPRSAIAATVVDKVVNVPELAPLLVQMCGPR